MTRIPTHRWHLPERYADHERPQDFLQEGKVHPIPFISIAPLLFPPINVPPFPSPPLRSPSSLSTLPFPPCREATPLNLAWGGERCKLPQRVGGGAPATNAFKYILSQL